MVSQVYIALGNVVKLLPAGTVFLFEYLNPFLTNQGKCSSTLNKYLTAILIAICGLTCFFSSFTDSYTGSDGKKHYAIVTPKGLWPSPASENVELSDYRLGFTDIVHAFFAVLVFAVLSLLDSHTVKCFYPKFQFSEKLLLQLLLPIFGCITSTVSLVFPSNRHGIGHPSSDDKKWLI